MRDGLEFMRPLTQAHLDLRAAREQPRHDVTDTDGDARTTCEAGHERIRVMIYGSAPRPGSPTAGEGRRTCTRKTRS